MSAKPLDGGRAELVRAGALNPTGALVVVLLSTLLANAAGQSGVPESNGVSAVPPMSAGNPATPIAGDSGYVLGPGDQIGIRVAQAPELADKPVQVDLNGYIELPWIGRVKAAGETVHTLRGELVRAFSAIVKDPEIIVTVDESRSQPVSILGAVTTPGVHQLQGHKTLIEVLSLAGGLRPDSGSTVNITRHAEQGPTGLPGETTDATGRFRMASIDLQQLMEARRPELNIIVRPNDVITVPRARMVYVIGEVNKPGGYVLSERQNYSVLEALSLAGGLTTMAAPQNSRILRPVEGEANRQEISLNVRRILNGQSSDSSLRAEDILFIPGSASKKAGLRAVEAAIQVGTGIAVWR